MRNTLRLAIAFAPWLTSMYLLYWLNVNEIWTSETAHRGKMAAMILVVGMVMSFLIQSNFGKRSAQP